jgi:uncharacterized protein (TIGR02301 family)
VSRFAALALAAVIAIPTAWPPAAFGQAPAARTPAERQTLADLAFVLGQSHALRQACAGAADQYWRGRMNDLVATERPDPGFERQLKLAFNNGYVAAQSAFPRCSRAARARLRQTAARGRDLAASLTGPVAEDDPTR